MEHWPVIEDRFEGIKEYILKGSVLDVGCVDSRPSRDHTDDRIERKPNLLFRRVCEANPDTLGVDIDPQGVSVLCRMGYKTVVGDVQTMDLGRTFNAIVAGEIIEHLENPGMFLKNMVKHLTPGGVLIVSTPNPFYQGQAWKIWRYGRPMAHEDHTHWHDPQTLSHLMRRSGLTPFDGFWIQPRRGLWKTWKLWLRRYFAHGFMILAKAAPNA